MLTARSAGADTGRTGGVQLPVTSVRERGGIRPATRAIVLASGVPSSSRPAPGRPAQPGRHRQHRKRPGTPVHPDHVIGHGTPASCTSQAVVRAVAAGGVITYSCGPRPVTVVMKVSNDRTGTLRIEHSRLRGNPNAGFHTAGYPGVFFLGRGTPVVIASTLS